MAGGFELVLACDIAIAVPQAVFGLPEVKRGLAAAAGGIFRLPRVLPRGLALELIATGDSINAQRAAHLGLVNRVVEADRLLPEALALAERVAANAPLAVAASLDVARRALDEDQAELRRRSQEVIDTILQSDDAREGPRAFAEKRAPRWAGR